MPRHNRARQVSLHFSTEDAPCSNCDQIAKAAIRIFRRIRLPQGFVRSSARSVQTALKTCSPANARTAAESSWSGRVVLRKSSSTILLRRSASSSHSAEGPRRRRRAFRNHMVSGFQRGDRPRATPAVQWRAGNSSASLSVSSDDALQCAAARGDGAFQLRWLPRPLSLGVTLRSGHLLGYDSFC
jgi:hypothetical protein